MRGNDWANRLYRGDGGSEPSADVLCQFDDDPGAAHAAEPVAVLVALQLADKLSALSPQRATTASMSSTNDSHALYNFSVIPVH